MNINEIKDIVSHTRSFFDTVKVYNDGGKTRICALNDERTIIFNGTLKNYHSVLDNGAVGINRMGILHGMLSYTGFNDSGSNFEAIVENKSGKDQLSELKLTSSNGTTSTYRFMGTQVVESKVKMPPFKGASADVTFLPTLKMISELSHFSNVLGGNDCKFLASTNRGKLEFHIGSTGNDRASITICDTHGTLKHSKYWNLAKFISILKLNDGGICSVTLSNQGLITIEMESDYCFYQYQMPSTKN